MRELILAFHFGYVQRAGMCGLRAGQAGMAGGDGVTQAHCSGGDECLAVHGPAKHQNQNIRCHGDHASRRRIRDRFAWLFVLSVNALSWLAGLSMSSRARREKKSLNLPSRLKSVFAGGRVLVMCRRKSQTISQNLRTGPGYLCTERFRLAYVHV